MVPDGSPATRNRACTDKKYAVTFVLGKRRGKGMGDGLFRKKGIDGRKWPLLLSGLEIIMKNCTDLPPDDSAGLGSEKGVKG